MDDLWTPKITVCRRVSDQNGSFWMIPRPGGRGRKRDKTCRPAEQDWPSRTGQTRRLSRTEQDRLDSRLDVQPTDRCENCSGHPFQATTLVAPPTFGVSGIWLCCAALRCAVLGCTARCGAARRGTALGALISQTFGPPKSQFVCGLAIRRGHVGRPLNSPSRAG